MSFSNISSAIPKLFKRSNTNVFSSAATKELNVTPTTPLPIFTGVFGIILTILVPGIFFSKSFISIAAAIEITILFFKLRLTSSSSVPTKYGFTPKNTISLFSTTSSRLLQNTAPVSSATFLVLLSEEFLTKTSVLLTLPLRSNPSKIAFPIFPTPIKPNFIHIPPKYLLITLYHTLNPYVLDNFNQNYFNKNLTMLYFYNK